MNRALLTLALLFVATFPADVLFAQAPRTISFQGFLTDARGNALPDGVRLVTLRIYDQSNGGTPLYEEAVNVAVERGVISTSIGGGTNGGIPAALEFDRAYFVAIAIDGGVELLPRLQMTSVPFALRASDADVASRATLADEATHAQNSDVATRAINADVAANATHADDATRATTSDVATRAVTADRALALAPDATGFIRSVNGREGDLTIVGEAGTTVSRDGNTLKVRSETPLRFPISTVHKVSQSALSIVDSSAFSSSGAQALLRLDVRDSTANRTAVHITSNAHGMDALNVSTRGGGSAANFWKSVDRLTTSGGTFIGPVLVAESRAGSQVTAAEFSAMDTSNSRPAVSIHHRGRGSGLQVDASGANIATFRRRRVTGAGSSSTSTVVRFDSTGKGFFDGGTQAGGADIAEAFDVAGDRDSFSRGDVLAISTTRKRQVAHSDEPYSMLIAGVYATKPGVLLTEEMNGTDLSAKVPMGVVGVIPTKVTGENGPIAIGDLIVSSSTRGHAMRGDVAVAKDRPGCIVGKALESFDGTGSGMILVLVTVR